MTDTMTIRLKDRDKETLAFTSMLSVVAPSFKGARTEVILLTSIATSLMLSGWKPCADTCNRYKPGERRLTTNWPSESVACL